MALNKFISRLVGGTAGGTILASSTLVSLWIAVSGGFVFYMDATNFFDYAVKLAQLRTTSNYIFSSGYPLLIALTGFPATGSVVPLLIVQAAFAALTPWLAFKTFARFDRTAGVLAGIVCLCSLTPFFFETMFYHDGTCLFFGFLAIALASAFFDSRRPVYIYLSLVSATFAYFAQPAVLGFVIGCAGAFAIFALRDRRQLKHVAAALGIFLAAVVGSAAAQKWSLRQQGSTVVPEQMGRRLFFNVYLEGAPYEKLSGVAAERLRNRLIQLFANHSFDELSSYAAVRLGGKGVEYQDLFGQYENHVTALVDRIFSEPNRQYFELLWNLPDFSDDVGDDVFLRASLGYIYEHPKAVVGYVWENFVGFAIGDPWSCRGHEVFPACKQFQGISFYPAMANEVILVPGQLPDRAYRFLMSRDVSRSVPMPVADGVWQWMYRHLRSVLLASMMIGWVASFWGPGQLRWVLGACVAAYLANTSIFSLFAMPEFRYQIPGLAVSAFAAGAGFYAVISLLARALEHAVPARIRIARKT
jgi:hypothetical protein